MLCQNCKEKTATIHLTEVINGKRIDLHLCEKCAKEQSQIEFDYPFSINNFLTGLFDVPIGYSVKNPQIKPKTEYKCSMCNLTFDEFRSTGKLGCGQCYNTFRENIIPILKRIHGNVHHSGKVPKSHGAAIKAKKEIEDLKNKLNVAIKKEEYEEAAKLRDKIKEREKANSEGRG